MSRVFICLLLVLLAGCQQSEKTAGKLDISITGDLVTDMKGGRVFADHNNTQGLPENITIGVTRGSRNNMTIFTLTLPPQSEVRQYDIISPPRNPQSRLTIRSAEASLFYVNGSDSREYSQGVTGQLTFTEVGATLSGTFEATMFFGSSAAGTMDSSRSINVNGTFSVPNPRM